MIEKHYKEKLFIPSGKTLAEVQSEVSDAVKSQFISRFIWYLDGHIDLTKHSTDVLFTPECFLSSLCLEFVDVPFVLLIQLRHRIPKYLWGTNDLEKIRAATVRCLSDNGVFRRLLADEINNRMNTELKYLFMFNEDGTVEMNVNLAFKKEFLYFDPYPHHVAVRYLDLTK